MNEEIYCDYCTKKASKSCYLDCDGIYAQAVHSLIIEDYAKQKTKKTGFYWQCYGEAIKKSNYTWTKQKIEDETFSIFKEQESAYIIRHFPDSIEKRKKELLERQKLSCEKL
ncbi:MAG: hypothetical protein J6B56_06095 [Clostridia bacterium]|nr:hypothetical protein [Clostridia bacterium]